MSAKRYVFTGATWCYEAGSLTPSDDVLLGDRNPEFVLASDHSAAIAERDVRIAELVNEVADVRAAHAGAVAQRDALQSRLQSAESRLQAAEQRLSSSEVLRRHEETLRIQYFTEMERLKAALAAQGKGE